MNFVQQAPGWVQPCPAVVVPPSTGHYPFERPIRRGRIRGHASARSLFQARIAVHLGNTLELYVKSYPLSQTSIHLSSSLSVQLNASFDPHSSGNIRGFVCDDDDEDILAITFLMLDDK